MAALPYYIINKVIVDVGISTVYSTVSNMISTSKNIYNIISGINSTTSTSCAMKIKSLDIEMKIRIIENMLNEISINKLNSKTITLSLESLNNIISEIEKELKLIHTKTKYNNSLWLFKSLRMHDYDENIIKIKDYKHILDNRLEIFFKLLLIKNELEINNEINTNKSNIITNDTITENYFTVSD